MRNEELMAFTKQVNLPKDHVPIFPDRCVACGQPAPTEKLHVRDEFFGWPWASKKHIDVAAPVCEWCLGSVRRQRWLRVASLWVGIIGGIALAFWLTWDWHMARLARKLVAVGGAIAGAAPFVLWQIFVPSPFAMTAFVNTVSYEFSDADYARDFAALNGKPMAEGGARPDFQ